MTSWLRRVDYALVMLVAAVGLRLFQPGLTRSFWLDEEMIAMNLRDRGLLELAGRLDHQQAAPLGWLWVERLLVVTLGTDEWALRLPPFLFGLGTLVAAYWFGRRRLGPVASVALVSLFGFSFALLRYGAELKHYSSDVFWVMVLIALAGWVLDRPESTGRLWTWWAVAAVGSWMSMGVVLATPAMALVLTGVVLRGITARPTRDTIRAVIRAGAPGVVWVILFGLHYALSLRAAADNDYLADYWDNLGYPPSQAGPVGVLHWYGRQVKVLLQTTFHLGVGDLDSRIAAAIGILFTGLVLLGLAVTWRRNRAFALILCAPLVSAALLALMRVTPLHGRLALWLVPAVFVAIATAMDVRSQSARWRQWAVYAAFLPMLVPFFNSVKTITQPVAVDDRAAVAWMHDRHRPGDVLLYVGSATRAGQWYDPEGRLNPSHMVVSVPPGPGCDPGRLRATVEPFERVIAYAGVRFRPYHNSYRVLEAQLAELGTITEVERFGTEGIVYVVDLSGTVTQTVAGTGHDCVKVS